MKACGVATQNEYRHLITWRLPWTKIDEKHSENKTDCHGLERNVEQKKNFYFSWLSCNYIVSLVPVQRSSENKRC